MLTRKKFQEIFSMAMGAFKNVQRSACPRVSFRTRPAAMSTSPGMMDGSIHLSKMESNSYPMSG